MHLTRNDSARTPWLALVLLIVALAAAPHAHAATHVWTNSGGITVGWDNDFNWQGLSRPPLVPAFVGDNSRVLMQHMGLDSRSYINQEYAITRLTFVDGFDGIELQFAALTILGAEGDIISESNELNRFTNAAVRFESQPVAGGSAFSIQTDDGDINFDAPITISANSTLDVTVSQAGADVRIFGGLSQIGNGTVDVRKLGAGELVLASNVSGITNLEIAAGKVRLDEGYALGAAMNFDIGADGEFDLDGFDANIDQLSGTGTVDLGLGTLTFGERVDIVASQTFGGVIRGAGGIIKNNTGEAVLAGANTYTGDTVITTGTLRLGASHRISNSSDLVVQAGASFDMGNFSESVRSLSGAGGTVTVAAGRFLRTTSNAGGTFTWGGVINGGGDFRHDGNHTLVINSVQANTGATKILDGTLQLAGGGDLSNTSDVEVATGATWDLSGLNDLVSTISGGGDIMLGGAELSLNSAAGISQFSGDISESGSLRKNGGHTLILSGSNSYNGKTTLAGGKLQITSSGNLGGGDVVFDGGELITSASLTNARTITMNSNDDALLTIDAGTTLTQSGDIVGSGSSDIVVDGGGTLRMTSAIASTFGGNIRIVDGTFDKAGIGNEIGSNTAVDVGPQGTFLVSNDSEAIGNLTGSGSVVLNESLGVGQDNGSTTFTGVVSGPGSFDKLGTGTLTLMGANTYTGDTIVADGTLRLGASHRISNGSNLVVQAGASFDMDNYTESVRSLSGAGGSVIIAEDQVLRTTSNAGGTFTWGGVLSGAGSFRQDGDHTLIVNGVQANTGNTNVLRGTLQLAGGGDLANTSTVQVATGATWDLSGLSDRVGAIFGGGDILLSGAELSVGRDSGFTRFSGNISESGSLIKDGAHTLILSGTNTYTGNTTISGGKLQIERSGNLGGGDLVFDGGELVTVASLTNARTITMNSNDDALLTVESGTTLTQSGDIGGGGSSDLVVDGGGTLRVTSAFASTFDGDIRIVDGTFDKAGSGDEIGPNTVVDVGPQGTFIMSNDTEGIGNLAGSGSVVLNKNLGVGQDNLPSTFSGVVSGPGSFDKLGTGTLVLTGNNTYNSSTDIEAGELQLSGSGQISNSSRVFVDSDATFHLNDVDDTVKELTGGGTVSLSQSMLSVGTANGSGNFSGAIVGSGSFSTVSTGSQTLTGTSNFTGDVLVRDSSQLIVSGGGSITNGGSVFVSDSAELVVTGAGSSLDLTDDLRLSGTSGATISDGAAVSANDGVSIGSISNSAYLTLDGGTLDGGNSFGVHVVHGSLTGHGTIVGDVLNLDRVAPGATTDGFAAVGILNIGDFHHSVGGVLSIELGGTDNSDTENPEFDALDIADSAILDGELEVTLLDYTPGLGDTFSILSANNVIGNFDNVADGERLVGVDGSTGSFAVDYSATEVILSDYRLFSPTADFDDDGDVDGEDLAKWQNDFGGPGSDADGDGISSGSDFFEWQRQLGLNGNPFAALQTVPEPSSALLLVGLTLLGTISRRH